jgi:hypothetical protein
MLTHKATEESPTFKVPKIPCTVHNGHSFTHLCLSPYCLKKCMCKKCLDEHHENHKIISIKEAILAQTSRILRKLDEKPETSLRTLHHNTILKLKTMQSELNQTFENLKTRINDIFQNIHESSSHYTSWAKSYLEKA